MLEINSSDWMYEFTYDGEPKRIHYFQHIPADMAVEMNKRGATDTAEVLDELLARDCGLHISDFDMASLGVLIKALKGDGEELGE